MKLKIRGDRKRNLTKLGIGCIVGLLLSFGVFLYAQEKTKAEFLATKPDMDAAKKSETNSAKAEALAKMKEQATQRINQSRGRQSRGGGSLDFGENEEFYKVIVDNNLFRPLGWTPPNNEPTYSVIGTAVAAEGGISQATLLEKRSNRYYFVTIGEKVGDMTVKDIQPKQVVLDKEGEAVTLRVGGVQFLATSRGNDRGGDRGRSGGSEGSAANSARDEANAKMQADKAKQEEMKSRAGGFNFNRAEMAEKMKNASPEERREIIREMRRRAGDRGDRGGRRGGRGRD